MCTDRWRHRRQGKCGQSGFSLFNLAMVLVIISVLLWVIGTRFFHLQVYAEEAITDQVISSIESGLGMKVAEYFVKGDVRRMEALEASNPMDNLAVVPKAYLGVLRQPKPGTIPGGHWYFDAGNRVLVYQVRNADHLEGGARHPARLRWRVRLQYEDRNGNKTFDPGIEQVVGVQLVPVEPFQWKR